MRYRTQRLSSLALLLAVCVGMAAGCGSDDDSSSTGTTSDEPKIPAVQPGQTPTLKVANLPRLTTAAYELWIVNGDERISMGQLNFDEAGEAIALEPVLDEDTGEKVDVTATPAIVDTIEEIDGFELTVEPVGDEDGEQSGPVVLEADHEGHESTFRFPVDVADAGGTAVVTTPTVDQDAGTDGIWFFAGADEPDEPSLSLPEVPDGWQWAAWATRGDTTLFLGDFTDVTGADSSNSFSGPGVAPLMPGEDLVRAVPGSDDGAANLAGGGWQVEVHLVPLVATGEGEPLPVEPRPFPAVVLRAEVPEGVSEGDVLALAPPEPAEVPRGTINF